MIFKLPIIIALSAFVFMLQGCKSQTETTAEQGQALSQLKLGKMYFKGEGMPENKVYAYMWTNLAMKQGLGSTASEYLNDISAQMTTSQIEEAEKISIERKKKSYKNC